MADKSKYDIFMDELSSLEKQIYRLVQHNQDLNEQNNELEKRLEKFQEEVELLNLKIEEQDTKQKTSSFSNEELFSLDSYEGEDKEELKNKLSELISKIDYHLRS